LKERINQKIGKIREYLKLLRDLEADCLEKFQIDPIYRGALLHYLYLMADTCVALAEQVIKLKSLRAPQSYHEAFDILGDAGVLKVDFAYSFAKIAGFRNFLAHDYEHVQSQVVCKDVLGQLSDVEEFLKQITSVL